MGKVRRIAALILTVAVIGVTAETAQAHTSTPKLIWEHATDVHRFFIKRPALASHKAGKKALRQHARLAYAALIGKWYRVHVCEGSWNANTGNGYYGGLQMDHSFQRSYGWEFISWWGTANNWPAWAQMTAAERAYRSGRGFGPWPVCGS